MEYFGIPDNEMLTYFLVDSKTGQMWRNFHILIKLFLFTFKASYIIQIHMSATFIFFVVHFTLN